MGRPAAYVGSPAAEVAMLAAMRPALSLRPFPVVPPLLHSRYETSTAVSGNETANTRHIAALDTAAARAILAARHLAPSVRLSLPLNVVRRPVLGPAGLPVLADHTFAVRDNKVVVALAAPSFSAGPTVQGNAPRLPFGVDHVVVAVVPLVGPDMPPVDMDPFYVALARARTKSSADQPWPAVMDVAVGHAARRRIARPTFVTRRNIDRQAVVLAGVRGNAQLADVASARPAGRRQDTKSLALLLASQARRLGPPFSRPVGVASSSAPDRLLLADTLRLRLEAAISAGQVGQAARPALTSYNSDALVPAVVPKDA